LQLDYFQSFQSFDHDKFFSHPVVAFWGQTLLHCYAFSFKLHNQNATIEHSKVPLEKDSKSQMLQTSEASSTQPGGAINSRFVVSRSFQVGETFCCHGEFVAESHPSHPKHHPPTRPTVPARHVDGFVHAMEKPQRWPWPQDLVRNICSWDAVNPDDGLGEPI
jgi:hypothetical protein